MVASPTTTKPRSLRLISNSRAYSLVRNTDSSFGIGWKEFAGLVDLAKSRGGAAADKMGAVEKKGCLGESQGNSEGIPLGQMNSPGLAQKKAWFSSTKLWVTLCGYENEPRIDVSAFPKKIYGLA
ncbi:MAG: hypothetical protein ACYTG0_41580 [Planctomycetota bacterium]